MQTGAPQRSLFSDLDCCSAKAEDCDAAACCSQAEQTQSDQGKTAWLRYLLVGQRCSDKQLFIAIVAIASDEVVGQGTVRQGIATVTQGDMEIGVSGVLSEQPFVEPLVQLGDVNGVSRLVGAEVVVDSRYHRVAATVAGGRRVTGIQADLATRQYVVGLSVGAGQRGAAR